MPYLYGMNQTNPHTMETVTLTPAREEEYAAQIEATRHVVENFWLINGATFDAYEVACKLVKIRGAALHADFTQLQEIKQHKDISRLVRQAEKLQAQVNSFQEKLNEVENAIYAKY